MEQKIKVDVKYEQGANLIVFFLRPAILLWMMPTIASLIPALAPLCALGYWQWVGMTLIIGWVCRWIGLIIHK